MPIEAVEVDGPGFGPPFVPTSAYEANWVRSWAVEFCQDNGLPAIQFTHATAHQFEQTFTVTAEGAMSTTMDLSPELEKAELARIHGR